MSLISANKDYDKVLLDKLVACYEEKLGMASKVIDVYFPSNPQLSRARRFCQQKKESYRSQRRQKQVIGMF